MTIMVSAMNTVQHTMRYLVVFVAIGLTAADEGPCFTHVDVSEKPKPISGSFPLENHLDGDDDVDVFTCAGQL